MVADLIVRGSALTGKRLCLHPTAHPELVEGLSFLLRQPKKEVRPFDKLRASGIGGLLWPGLPKP
jgi:hypothetical protein